MDFSFAQAAIFQAGDTRGALTVVFRDVPDLPETFTAEWSLRKWGDGAEVVAYTAATVGDVLTHTDPATGIDHSSFTVALDRDEVPSEAEGGLHYVCIKILDGSDATTLVHPRRLPVLVYAVPE